MLMGPEPIKYSRTVGSSATNTKLLYITLEQSGMTVKVINSSEMPVLYLSYNYVTGVPSSSEEQV